MKRKLTPKEHYRIRKVIGHKLMNFAPTIAPAYKNLEQREIESIAEALNYYARHGVSLCSVQPKYMGSYCDIYLHRELEQTRFFSKNGYLISKQVEHAELLQVIKTLHQKLNWDGVELRLIQSELMPWSTLGKGLIERDFGGYEICHRSHLKYLTETKLPTEIEQLKLDSAYQTYLQEREKISKIELSQKYPDHIVKQYEALSVIKIPNVEHYQQDLDLYHSQLELYGAEGPVYFKPFNLLKTILTDGREEIHTSNVQGYESVGSDSQLVVHLTPENNAEAISQAEEFFRSLVAAGAEGVVIKPDEIYLPDITPMFKVRNHNYLQLIYGVNFNRNYEYYLTKRRVDRKIRCSINEWKISQLMLRIPAAEITEDNQNYYELVRARIVEEEFEATLDGRL